MSEIEVVVASSPEPTVAPVVQYAPLPELGEIAPGIRRIAVSRGDAPALPPEMLAAMAKANAESRRFYAYKKSRVLMSGWPSPLEGDEPEEVTAEEANALMEAWNGERLAERAKDMATAKAERDIAQAKFDEANRLRGALLMKIATAAGIDPYEVATGMGMSPDVAKRLVDAGRDAPPEPPASTFSMADEVLAVPETQAEYDERVRLGKEARNKK